MTFKRTRHWLVVPSFAGLLGILFSSIAFLAPGSTGWIVSLVLLAVIGIPCALIVLKYFEYFEIDSTSICRVFMGHATSMIWLDATSIELRDGLLVLRNEAGDKISIDHTHPGYITAVKLALVTLKPLWGRLLRKSFAFLPTSILGVAITAILVGGVVVMIIIRGGEIYPFDLVGIAFGLVFSAPLLVSPVQIHLGDNCVEVLSVLRVRRIEREAIRAINFVEIGGQAQAAVDIVPNDGWPLRIESINGDNFLIYLSLNKWWRSDVSSPDWPTSLGPQLRGGDDEA